LTFNEEYAIEALWHEINHNRVKKYLGFFGDSPQKILMETVNQFVSRHTYDDFLRKLGGEAKFKAQILEGGYGYTTMVNNFRYLLKRIGFEETTALKRLQKILFDD